MKLNSSGGLRAQVIAKKLTERVTVLKFFVKITLTLLIFNMQLMITPSGDILLRKNGESNYVSKKWLYFSIDKEAYSRREPGILIEFFIVESSRAIAVALKIFGSSQ